MICPYCQTGVKESEAKLCPVCGMPHHAECWQENGGCTVYGCTGRAQVDRPPLVANIDSPVNAAPLYYPLPDDWAEDLRVALSIERERRRNELFGQTRPEIPEYYWPPSFTEVLQFAGALVVIGIIVLIIMAAGGAL